MNRAIFNSRTIPDNNGRIINFFLISVPVRHKSHNMRIERIRNGTTMSMVATHGEGGRRKVERMCHRQMQDQESRIPARN